MRLVGCRPDKVLGLRCCCIHSKTTVVFQNRPGCLTHKQLQRTGARLLASGFIVWSTGPDLTVTPTWTTNAQHALMVWVYCTAGPLRVQFSFWGHALLVQVVSAALEHLHYQITGTSINISGSASLKSTSRWRWLHSLAQDMGRPGCCVKHALTLQFRHCCVAWQSASW